MKAFDNSAEWANYPGRFHLHSPSRFLLMLRIPKQRVGRMDGGCVSITRVFYMLRLTDATRLGSLRSYQRRRMVENARLASNQGDTTPSNCTNCCLLI